MAPVYIGSNLIPSNGLGFGSFIANYAFVGSSQVFPFASPNINPQDKTAAGRSLVKDVPIFNSKILTKIMNPICSVEIE